jgi:phosphoribosyl-AMP cyclohydrolase
MTEELPIEWPSDGLIPAVIQDAHSRDVLMLGFMNEEALALTRETGLVHFYSRSRQRLWQKGESSGHTQTVHDIFVNCEQNSLLIEVTQIGAVCHDGYPTCYYRRIETDGSLEIVRDRWFDPLDVYGTQNGARTTLERWWGAYEYLREQEGLAALSSTAGRLRDESTSLASRVADELRELAGVLEGTHVHTQPVDDVVLEGSQVCYWIACELIRQRVTFADIRTDRAMDIPEGDAASANTVAALLRAEADHLTSAGLSAEKGHQLYALVANAARSLGVDPLALIRRDVEELSRRDYLAPYFAE